MARAYYNEFDPGAAAWLRELIAAGLIADGDVDERSILDVQHSELSDYSQCHFFAGIGGWSLALRLAGWPDGRPVWTGSPPCQPFSAAGQQLGKDDPRHLAPHFISLVGACRPRVLFGEQVASSDVFGKAAKRARGNFVAPPQWAWLDDLSDRLEAARYAVGASDFPSAGVGAPHIRQRTFFGAVDLERLADRNDTGRQGRLHRGPDQGRESLDGHLGRSGATGGLADASCEGRFPGAQRGIHCGEEGAGPRDGEPERPGDAGRLADAHGGNASAERKQRGGEQRQQPQDGGAGDRDRWTGPLHGFWSDADWLLCRDGKWRPVESGTFPLDHGVSGRVGLLRGYGNAINPWAAKEFIEAFTESIDAAAL